VKKIIAISLALLMLVSNIGFSMNTHFCGGKAVETSFSIGLHNPSCGMEEMNGECETAPSPQGHIKATPCCANEHLVLQLDDDVDICAPAVSSSLVFFTAFVHAFVHPLIDLEQTADHSPYYLPPISEKDVQVLLQTFLI